MPAARGTPVALMSTLPTRTRMTVAEALRDPEDILIAEGTPVYDPELEGMAVYVTNVTTKVLQQAKRAEQQG